MIGPNSSPLYRPPNLTKSHEETTGLPPPPTSSISCLKPADRRKTYLITAPDSVSILSTREEVPRVHRVEVESCAPYATSFWSTQHSLISSVTILLIPYVIISLILFIAMRLIPLVTRRATLTTLVLLFSNFCPGNTTFSHFTRSISVAETTKPY